MSYNKCWQGLKLLFRHSAQRSASCRHLNLSMIPKSMSSSAAKHPWTLACDLGITWCSFNCNSVPCPVLNPLPHPRLQHLLLGHRRNPLLAPRVCCRLLGICSTPFEDCPLMCFLAEIEVSDKIYEMHVHSYIYHD